MSTHKNLLYNVINNIANVAFPIISVPYVSRVLGVENIGIVAFATTFAGYFVIFASLGISIYGAKEISKLRESSVQRNKLFSELFIIMIFSSLICSLIYIISIYSIPTLLQQKSFLLISGTVIYLNSFSLDWFFMGRENFKIITLRSVIIKILSLILMFCFVRNQSDALWYCAITAFSIFANNLWNFIWLITKEMKISFKCLHVKKHIRPLFTLLSTNLAIAVYTTLDTLMLAFMCSYKEVGYYSSATKVSRILLPFAVATTSVMIPKISYAFIKDDKTEYFRILKRSFSFMAFLSAPMCVGLFIVSKTFVPLFFGEEFLLVIPVLQIQSIILLFVGISNFFGIQVLATSNLESKLLFSILLGAGVNFLLNLIIIPHYGAIGASATSAFAEFVIMISTFLMGLKIAKVKVGWSVIFESLLSTLPMLVLYVILPDTIGVYGLPILISFGSISYFFCQYFVFKNVIAIELLDKIKKMISWI